MRAVHVSHAILLREKLRGWRLEGGGGVALDLVVHDIDLLQFITGSEPVSVSAIGTRQGLSAGPPDALMAVGALGDNTLFSIHNAYTVPYPLTGIEIHGTAGSLIGRDCLTPHHPEVSNSSERDAAPSSKPPPFTTSTLPASTHWSPLRPVRDNPSPRGRTVRGPWASRLRSRNRWSRDTSRPCRQPSPHGRSPARSFVNLRRLRRKSIVSNTRSEPRIRHVQSVDNPC
ncbi:Gfo/Idh/MocA family protein [Rhodococcus koreensis]